MTLRDALFDIIGTHPCIKLEDLYFLRAPDLYRQGHPPSCACPTCRRRNSHESAIRRDLLKLERSKAINSDYVRVRLATSRYPHHNKVMWIGYPGRSRNNLGHDSDVTSFHVRLRLACEEYGLDDPQWKYGTQRNAMTRDVNPDGIFIISRPDHDYLCPFFYEEERKRGHYLGGDPQIVAKVKRYAVYRRSPNLTHDFGFNDARLAIRCATDATMTNLLRDLSEIAPYSWIWVSSIPRAKANLMGHIWHTPRDHRGRALSLLTVA